MTFKICWPAVHTKSSRRTRESLILVTAPTQGLKITEENMLSLSHVCKWLEFLVFSDKDEKHPRPSLKNSITKLALDEHNAVRKE